MGIAEPSHAPLQAAGDGPKLFYDWERSLYPPQVRRAALGSAAVHALLLAALLVAPPMDVRLPTLPEVRVDTRRSEIGRASCRERV